MPQMFMARPKGLVVRELRRKRRWTQDQLARKIGRTRQSISKVEASELVSLTLLNQVANVLRVGLPVIEDETEIPADEAPVLQRAG